MVELVFVAIKNGMDRPVLHKDSGISRKYLVDAGLCRSYLTAELHLPAAIVWRTRL